ncbi:MAG: hypothetical protein IJ219_10040 [Bacteroidaceae bacterium]|nr:hypothetical protein [Bacteroidaceae bacterium]
MMSALLLYSIKSALVLTMLYVPYVLMLRRENFFRFNRLVLLGILLLSLVLPLCNISALSLDRQPVVQAAQLQMLEMGIPVHVLPEVEISASPLKGGLEGSFSLFHLLTFIYIIGMAGLLMLRFWQMSRLQLGLKKGVLWHNDEGGVRIYCHAEDVAPFSWMRNIVINEKDYDEAGREIVLHEIGHIQGRHSWDVVLLTLVQMVQWWNPMCYMLGISLRDVHEYEADSYVLRQGVSAQGYQLLLIRKAVGSGSYAFANSFNHSLTKKRITMMKKSKSNPWMRSKALYVIPVAALALSAFATPKIVAPIEEAVTNLEGKGTENSVNLQVPDEKKKPVAQKDMTQSSTENVILEEVKQQDTEGRPLFVLDGKIIEVSKDVNFGTMNSEEQFSSLLNINVEDIESITVLKNDAATKVWGDKGANGVIVITTKSKDDVKELVKKLPGAEMDDDGNITVGGKSVAKIMLEDKTIFNNNDTIYNVVKERAKFPGGDEECFKFLSENVRYPKLCHEFGVQGRVIVRFVVEKDGSITHVEKVRGVGKTLSEVEVTSYKQEHPDSPEQLKAGQDLGNLLFEEAKRVMELMPKWEPAKDKDGNAVRSFFNLPFMFRLQ